MFNQPGLQATLTGTPTAAGGSLTLAGASATLDYITPYARLRWVTQMHVRALNALTYMYICTCVVKSLGRHAQPVSACLAVSLAQVQAHDAEKLSGPGTSYFMVSAVAGVCWQQPAA